MDRALDTHTTTTPCMASAGLRIGGTTLPEVTSGLDPP